MSEWNANRYPLNLRGYTQTRLTEMSPNTYSNYFQCWKMLSKKQHLVAKDGKLEINLEKVVNSTIEKYQNNLITDATFRRYRASICLGLALHLEQQQSESTPSATIYTLPALDGLYRKIISIEKHTGSLKTSNRTSGLKMKSFPKGLFDFVQIQDNARSNTRHLLKLFLKANVLVGLRPIEWRTASFACNLEKKVAAIVVDNGKNSQGRANGDQRFLLLEKATPTQLESLWLFRATFLRDLGERIKTVNEWLDNYSENENPVSSRDTDNERPTQIQSDNALYQKRKSIADSIFEQANALDQNKKIQFKDDELLTSDQELHSHIYSLLCRYRYENLTDRYGNPAYGIAESCLRSMQRLLNTLDQQYWLQRINYLNEEKAQNVTLYSTRHQCIANAKAAKVPVVQIAAFFGHASILTARRHYGLAGSAWGDKFTFRPSTESINAVHGYKLVGARQSENNSENSSNQQRMNSDLDDKNLDEWRNM